MFLKSIITIVLCLKLTSCETHYTNECKNDWFNYKNKKCIKVWNQSKVNYTEAIGKCQSFNASLVIIGSEEENLFLTSILYDLDTEVKGLYIGLKRKIQNDSYINEFEWTDSSSLSYENWAPGEPSPWFEPCVEMYSVDINAGKWNDLSCKGHRHALCQQIIDQNTTQNEYRIGFELCEHLDYVRYRNNCYKAYDQNSALDWESADAKCKSDHKSSGLVYIEDSYEHSFIKYWTKSELKSFEMWIGLIAKTNNKNIRYEWVSEWPLYYTAWDSEQPKFLPQSVNQCVVQDIKTGLWRSDPYCSDKRPFVCKVSDHRVSGDQMYVSYVCPKFKNSTTGQPQEWINLHKNLKHCHWFSETVAMNWSDASKHCHKRDGTLASIHSRHESELLKPFLQKYGRPLWIGLYQSPGGFYRWEDGSALDFQNWFPGEPTDEKKELCVEMRAQDMTWNDIDCSECQLQFICEINKMSTNQTLIENNLKNSITTTDPLNTITFLGEETEGQGLKGWSRVFIWLIMVILVVASILVIVSYLWWEKIITYLSEKFNNFSNSGTYSTSSGVDSQRSSVNDRNSFHIHDIN